MAGSLGNAITSGLGSLTMHARGGGGTSGSGGGGAGGIVSSRSNSNNHTDGGGGTSSRHHVVHHVQQNPTSSTSSSSSPPPSQQQQQSSSSQPPLTRRRDSHSSSTRYKSSAQSVVSIGSTSVFSPSIIGTSVRSGNGGGGNGGGGQNELQPSSARLLRDLNKSAQSSLLSSLGTAAASRTFRSYKMMLPRYVPRMAMMTTTTGGGGVGGIGPDEENDKGNNNATTAAPPIETDLELLGRTVHAVSSALTEPPRVGDRYMIYDVSFNPRGCVWDASVVVYDDDEEEEEDDEGDEKRTAKKSGGGESGTFTFPIRVTCAEDEDDDDYDDDLGDGEQDGSGGVGGASSRPRAKTYAVELSIIDDTVHNLRNAADHRDDIKHSVEWISYGIRRSMARSMFPQFPEGCRGRPFREVYQLNKKVRTVVLCVALLIWWYLCFPVCDLSLHLHQSSIPDQKRNILHSLSWCPSSNWTTSRREMHTAQENRTLR